MNKIKRNRVKIGEKAYPNNLRKKKMTMIKILEMWLSPLEKMLRTLLIRRWKCLRRLNCITTLNKCVILPMLRSMISSSQLILIQNLIKLSCCTTTMSVVETCIKSCPRSQYRNSGWITVSWTTCLRVKKVECSRCQRKRLETKSRSATEKASLRCSKLNNL